jgi:phosphoglycerol geranylgeranyltransferase
MVSGRQYQYLLSVIETKGAGYLTLLDPDKFSPSEIIATAISCNEAGADAILIGSSILMNYSSGNAYDNLLKDIQDNIQIPLLIFPGNTQQLSTYADALLYLSLISGRNPNWLIGEHVISAPIIKKLGLEAIPTGYMLVESGAMTSVQFMSNTMPIPHKKSDIAVAHGLAAEYLGMRLIYLEAGSGAQYSVSEEMIAAVKENVSIPIIVGGGIRNPEDAAKKVDAGADFIVTGNIIEDKNEKSLLEEFAKAIHFS